MSERRSFTAAEPAGALFAVSVVITLVALVTGGIFFRSTERTFADII